MYVGTNAESSEKQSDKNIQLSDILEIDEDDIPEMKLQPFMTFIYRFDSCRGC